jgi:hypothetical protein
LHPGPQSKIDPCRNDRCGAGITDRRNEVMGTSTTVGTGRFPALARLAVALGIAVGLLAGQLAFTDAPQVSAAKSPIDAAGDDLEELRRVFG